MKKKSRVDLEILELESLEKPYDTTLTILILLEINDFNEVDKIIKLINKNCYSRVDKIINSEK